jgi:hypothetical protein
VHGYELVIKSGVDQLDARHEQFKTNAHRERTTHKKHREGEPQIQGTDLLVVCGQRPPSNERG